MQDNTDTADYKQSWFDAWRWFTSCLLFRLLLRCSFLGTDKHVCLWESNISRWLIQFKQQHMRLLGCNPAASDDPVQLLRLR
jgi:hypothetical protein